MDDYYNDYYWDADCWGSMYPPENWKEIVDAANEKIDEFIEENSLNIYAPRDVDEIRRYSDRLWETWEGIPAEVGVQAGGER